MVTSVGRFAMLDYCNTQHWATRTDRRHLPVTNRLIPTLVVLLLLFTGACWSNGFDDDVTTVTVDIDGSDDVTEQSGKHVGDNVTLTCRVSSPNVVDSSKLQWRKSTTASDLREETITVGEDLSALYAGSAAGRYEVFVVNLSEITYYILHIYMVKHEDSGRIRCSVANADYARDHDSAMLHVYKRPSPDDVSFDNYAEGSELTVHENKPTSLTCRVRHVLPQPHITLHVHNRTLGSHLPTNVSVNVYCPVDATKTALCPVHYDLDVAVTAPYLTATHRDDGHRVTCSAGLSRANWTPVIATLHLNVLYRPRFDCSRSMSVVVNTRNVVIRCQLQYNPRPSMLRVRWRRNNDPTELALQAGDSILDRYRLDETSVIFRCPPLCSSKCPADTSADTGFYTRVLSVDRPGGLSDEQYPRVNTKHPIMILDVKSWKDSAMLFVITEVVAEDYGAYHFEATNEIGFSSHTIHLIQFHPPRTTTVTTTKHTLSRPSSATSRPRVVVTPTNSATKTSTSSFCVAGSVVTLLLLCLVDVRFNHLGPYR